MSEYLFYQHRYNTAKNSKTELCRLDRKAQKALTTVKGENGNGKKGN